MSAIQQSGRIRTNSKHTLLDKHPQGMNFWRQSNLEYDWVKTIFLSFKKPIIKATSLKLSIQMNY